MTRFAWVLTEQHSVVVHLNLNLLRQKLFPLLAVLLIMMNT